MDDKKNGCGEQTQGDEGKAFQNKCDPLVLHKRSAFKQIGHPKRTNAFHKKRSQPECEDHNQG